MKVKRSLHITALLTALLAIFILGIGERNFSLAVLGVFVCGAGFFIKEVYDKHLNTFWGNLAALAALVVAIWSFEIQRPELRLIAMANLLVYAQFVLFYRERIPQTYWMILLLSLLQICVASVLINDFYFAFLLLAYLLLATRMVFLLTYRRECYDAMNERAAAVKMPAIPRTKRPRSAQATNGQPAAAAAGRRLHWDLSRQAGGFVPRSSRQNSTTEFRGFGKHWAGLCLLTAILVPVLFAILPRPYAEGGLVSGDMGGLNSTGFDTKVTLGELGMILESTEEVMRVSFKTRGGEPIQLQSGHQPLLRGVAYSDYDDGEWKLAGVSQGPARPLQDWSPGDDDYIVQEILIVPDKHNFLFGVYPVYEGYDEAAKRVKWDTGHRAMIRAGDRTRETRYVTLTTGIKNGQMVDIVDILNEDHPSLGELRRFPSNKLQRLKQAAADVIAGLPADSDDIAKARALESYLKDSGQFSYSLKPPVRDPNIDPIEDFLFNNPSGHCEYFASALTLMLRSQGIPARMVNGYKGGDWNNLGKFYQIRQLHAHVWVEVQVSDPTVENVQFARKKWLILDPTPGAAIETSAWSNVRQFTDYVQYMWSSYVLGLNSTNQNDAIYNELLNPRAWRNFIDEVRQLFSGQGTFSGFMNLRFIVTLLVLPLFIYGAARLCWKLSGWLRGQDSKKRKTRMAAQAEVEFYRRFEKILAQRRIRREAAQTQREFAMAIGGQFSAETSTRSLAAIPKFVVDAFYRVRFGHMQLAPEEQQKLFSELDRLESEVSKVVT